MVFHLWTSGIHLKANVFLYTISLFFQMLFGKLLMTKFLVTNNHNKEKHCVLFNTLSREFHHYEEWRYDIHMSLT